MDDFSWGTTRVVVGDNNKKQVYVTEEEKFDPRSIPLRKWTEYEAELWENTSDVSRSSRRSAASKSSHRSSASKASRGSKRRSSAASKRRSSARYVPGFGGPPSDADFVTSYIPLGVDPASFAGAGARASQPSAPALRPAGTPDAPPTDDELTMEIRYIIANENLMELTKKQIREKLQVFFGCDLSGRREFINRTVEDVLQGKI
ncbi:MAG: DEK C terminal domain-containing protein [Olpidium bornovanus]|uniref:DEK C terminal domain-containing protein n=1 Tax=Olpidium bornovanus TaxID=278681 RepID=A0A8H7ZU97_9FUNG|nr:MAG: DEK C terminal domain-containing protein [Olpidium bornovanus]